MCPHPVAPRLFAADQELLCVPQARIQMDRKAGRHGDHHDHSQQYHVFKKAYASEISHGFSHLFISNQMITASSVQAYKIVLAESCEIPSTQPEAKSKALQKIGYKAFLLAGKHFHNAQ